MNEKKEMWLGILAVFLLAIFVHIAANRFICTESIRILQQVHAEDAEFRKMQFSTDSIKLLGSLSHKIGMKPGEILALLYPETNGNYLHIQNNITKRDLLDRKKIYISSYRKSYEKVYHLYGSIWNDVRCFPVSEDAEVTYENSWMFERNYGGVRGHEGTDLMPSQNIPGHFRILSMTDGVVEKTGWLEKGGYRIGIRSPSGAYFYYAHLDSYSREFQTGETISAGEVLGYMGDTGYGEEVTRGQFPVHLHLGIYIRTDFSEELSINPYWILRFLEQVIRQDER